MQYMEQQEAMHYAGMEGEPDMDYGHEGMEMEMGMEEADMQ